MIASASIFLASCGFYVCWDASFLFQPATISFLNYHRPKIAVSNGLLTSFPISCVKLKYECITLNIEHWMTHVKNLCMSKMSRFRSAKKKISILKQLVGPEFGIFGQMTWFDEQVSNPSETNTWTQIQLLQNWHCPFAWRSKNTAAPNDS